VNWLVKLSKIDRRVVFLLIGAAAVIPLLKPLWLPVHVTEHVQKVFDFIENIPVEGQAVLLSVDYTPETFPELHPMTLAILRHCFTRNLKVVCMTLQPAGPGIAELALGTVAAEYGRKYGEDYVLLGYRPGISPVILGIGEDIKRVFVTDNYATDLGDIRMMDEIRNYDDIALVVTISGSSIPESWISYAHSRYGQLIASGVTAVMAADFYPYLQTGQFIGMLGGLKGASEYEILVERAGFSRERKTATIGMDSQSVVHLVIIVFIVLGNLAYFASRRTRREEV